jgi:hypothetical protein
VYIQVRKTEEKLIMVRSEFIFEAALEFFFAREWTKNMKFSSDPTEFRKKQQKDVYIELIPEICIRMFLFEKMDQTCGFLFSIHTVQKVTTKQISH